MSDKFSVVCNKGKENGDCKFCDNDNISEELEPFEIINLNEDMPSSDDLKNVEDENNETKKIYHILKDYCNISETQCSEPGDSEEEYFQEDIWDDFELARPHIQKFDNKQAEKARQKASKLQKRHKVMVRYKNTTPTVEFDEPTKYLLRRLMTSRYMSRFGHIMGTGSNSVVIYGNSSTCWSWRLPWKVVVKVYENTEAACKRAQNELKSLERLERWRINAPRPVCAWRNIIVMGAIGYGTTAPSITSAPRENDLINYLHIIDSMRRMYQIAKVVHGNLSHRSILGYGPPYFISLAHSVPTDHADALKLLIKDCFNVTHLFKDKGLAELKTTEELFKFITDLPEIDDSLLKNLENIKTSKPKSDSISFNSKYPIEKPPANYAPVLEFCSKLHR